MASLGLAGAAMAVGTASLAGASPADNPTARATQDRPIRGDFSLVMMVHTSSGGFGNLEGVNPWDGTPTPGRYAYRSIPCTGNAPVNNISSDLPSYNTRIAGSRSPTSMRAHPFTFQVRRHRGRWEMFGSIKFTVCKLGGGATAAPDPIPDESKPKIIVGFRAAFRRTTNESLRWAGRFRIEGGTGRYRELTGSGTIAGYLMCFAPEGCPAAGGGRYLDGQFTMQGAFRDPTPSLANPDLMAP